MKKILFAFLLTGIIPNCLLAVPAAVPAHKFTSANVDANGLEIYTNECKPYNIYDEKNCSSQGNDSVNIADFPGWCYVSDSDGSTETACEGREKVCILGNSSNKDYDSPVSNGCWQEDGNSWKVWRSENPVCSGGIWANAKPSTGGTGRIKVFVGQEDGMHKYYVSSNGRPMKSIVYKEATPINIVCWAYICKDRDGNANVGCSNGTCSDPCPEDVPDPVNVTVPSDPRPSGGAECNVAEPQSTAKEAREKLEAAPVKPSRS